MYPGQLGTWMEGSSAGWGGLRLGVADAVPGGADTAGSRPRLQVLSLGSDHLYFGTFVRLCGPSLTCF